VSHLADYKGKALQSVAKGDLDLGKLAGEEAKAQREEAAKRHGDLLARMKAVLGEAAKDVRVSDRLTESPACLVVEQHEMSPNLARVLKQLGQDAPLPTPVLEVNVGHPLVGRLEAEQDENRFADLTRILFDQAVLAEGGQLDDPATFVQRLNRLVLSLAGG